MALVSQQLQRSLLTRIDCYAGAGLKTATPCSEKGGVVFRQRSTRLGCRCSAIAIDAPTSVADVSGIRWGSVKLQGARDEMEDDLVIVAPESADGFSFAAVFDGHGGVSSVEFLREEIYRECYVALEGDLLLRGKDHNAIKGALRQAFTNLDSRLLKQLEINGEEDESGATATVMLVRNDMLVIAHVGDSSVVLSCSGRPEILTSPHRPYGSNKSSLQEIRRIREAGGWIVNGRICGDIAVSRAFGDIRFKTRKYEMLKKGVEEGRWTEKFISRIRFNGDLISVCPDIFQVELGSDAEFILLASDGLWDYMNSSEAVDFVRNQLRHHGSVQQACESLGRAVLDQQSQDNISIVIADLGRTNWQSLPVKQQNILLELGQALATIGIVSLGIWVSSQLSL